MSDIQCHFTSFVQEKAQGDPNWKFWDDYVSLNALSYIALFAAIRSGNWTLRLASIKLMAPIFSAFDRPTYRKLLPQHLADCLLLPNSIQEQFAKGGFVVSITGQAWHSVGIDEAHKMLVNRDCKSAVVHPNKEFINRMALYFPFRSKMMQAFKNQVNQNLTLEGPDHNKKLHRKARENIHTMTELRAKSDTLPLQATDCMLLRNGFTGVSATSAQQSDLINFRHIDQNDFDAYVEHVHLRTCNTKASVNLNRLTTFSTTSRNVTKQQYAWLQAEKKTCHSVLKETATAQSND